jgi:hypothetical protein
MWRFQQRFFTASASFPFSLYNPIPFPSYFIFSFNSET